MPNVRQAIVDAINEINEVLPTIANDNAQYSQLMVQRAQLNRQLTLLLSERLTGCNDELIETVIALKELVRSAEQAQQDVLQVQHLVDKAVKAVKAVENVIQGVQETI